MMDCVLLNGGVLRSFEEPCETRLERCLQHLPYKNTRMPVVNENHSSRTVAWQRLQRLERANESQVVESYSYQRQTDRELSFFPRVSA